MAVPDGQQLVGQADEDLTACHMGLGIGDGHACLVHIGGQSDKAVVGGVMPVGKALAVPGGRDDGLDAAAVGEDRFRPPGVRAVRETGHTDQLTRGVLCHRLGQQRPDALFYLRVQATVAGDPYAHTAVSPHR